MIQKQEKKSRIKIKRIQIRGDEVAILFFSLVFLAFLFVSFFRLFAIGKLFDDFLFTFLFGWSKYLFYGFLFILLLPIFFNFYFRIRISFIIGIIFTFFITSWFVENISMIINNHDQLPWRKASFYNFKDLSSYFQTWWGATIINNYHGFFAKPLSFSDWSNVTTFFPSFATGGIVANFLVYISAFGGFVSGLISSSVLLFAGLSWVLLDKPWILLWLLFGFLIPIFTYIRKKRIEHISQKAFEHKTQLSLVDQLNKEEVPKQAPMRVSKKETSKFELQPVKTIRKKEPNREIILQDVIQESGTLAPFGQIDQRKKQNDNEEEI